jgi:S1-C subfamily serine protease
VERGVLVVEVLGDSPAEKAGLQGSSKTVTFEAQDVPAGGDVILAIDEQSVRKFDDLLSYLTDNTRAGQAVTLSILRDGQQQTVKVVLDTRPAAASNQP